MRFLLFACGLRWRSLSPSFSSLASRAETAQPPRGRGYGIHTSHGATSQRLCMTAVVPGLVPGTHWHRHGATTLPRLHPCQPQAWVPAPSAGTTALVWQGRALMREMWESGSPRGERDKNASEVGRAEQGAGAVDLAERPGELLALVGLHLGGGDAVGEGDAGGKVAELLAQDGAEQDPVRLDEAADQRAVEGRLRAQGLQARRRR